MTTKPPSSVRAAEYSALEKIAYASVALIPTAEPHDNDRLGYNVWRFLSLRRDSLEFAVRSAGAHLRISEEEAVERIRQALRERGVSV
ncbi:MAG TPA: hypothetical protein VL126_01540 [Bacteroidota bacterium]|nr:hypothetical protein [Bacteroidota bacterium]